MSVYNIIDFGAQGDGVTKNTQFIQECIDACAANGGGRVVIPAGNYLSGSILLKSNVNLFLESGSRLISSIDWNDIFIDEEFRKANSGYFIGAINAHNISITGFGKIDGQGDQLMEEDDGISEYPLLPGEPRIRLCYFRGCNDLSIRDITMMKSSQWTVHMIGCTRVVIHGINILNNLRGANNDGIDPDACKDVRISDCHIEGGDDAIVIKTTQNAAKIYGSCEDIIVSNCTLVSRDSAIKIGTETWADIRNCIFTNCIVRNSNRGLGIWVRDGGTVENIIATHMVFETRMFRGAPHRERVKDWWGKGEPLFMSAGYRTEGVYPGKIRKVLISGVFAECENSVFINGCSESYIENVTLMNLSLLFRMRSGLPGGLFDLQPPEEIVFAHHNPAIYGNYVNNLKIIDTRITWDESKSEHWSNAVFCKNVSNLHINRMEGGAAWSNFSVIEVEDVNGIEVIDCIAQDKKHFLSVRDIKKENVSVSGNRYSYRE